MDPSLIVGRRLTCTDPSTMFLSSCFFVLLQARLAYHEKLTTAGGLRYEVGKGLIFIEPLNDVAVLLEYDEQNDDHIDVLGIGIASKVNIDPMQVSERILLVALVTIIHGEGLDFGPLCKSNPSCIHTKIHRIPLLEQAEFDHCCGLSHLPNWSNLLHSANEYVI
jgi:hypothetical protein